SRFGRFVFVFAALMTQNVDRAKAEVFIQSHVSSTRIVQGDTEVIVKLAKQAKDIVDSGIFDFSSDTLPHQAKDLRKQIVRLRDILDVFSYNFAHEIDLWNEVRDGLDDGYTVVGEFKDLFDADAVAVAELSTGGEPTYKDQKKLKERRKKVLKWKLSYLSERGLSDKIQMVFGNIRPLEMVKIRPSKKFSEFFWGGVNVLPSPTNSPSQNARVLIDAQAELAFAEHPVVLDLKDPTTAENEIIFHDHRKRLRTIAKVCNLGSALSEELCNSESVKELEALVMELGEIEDLIITGRHLEEDDKNSRAKDAYEDAKKLFKKLKKKFDGIDMLKPLAEL
ncbi:hypothetical protein EBR21_11195, partial [bacterium]|nr:hypothetical protein [bacterium]